MTYRNQRFEEASELAVIYAQELEEEGGERGGERLIKGLKGQANSLPRGSVEIRRPCFLRGTRVCEGP